MGSTSKRLLSLAGIYALVVGVALLLYFGHFLDSWQEKLTDRFYTRHEPQQSIVVIAIDDESLNKIGQWPWPRAVFATALGSLSGASAVGIDVSFSEGSRLGAADDQALASALRNLGSTTVVVLPVQLAPRGKVGATPLPLFAEQAETGFVNLPVDSDGVIRSVVRSRDAYRSFSSALAEAASSTAPARAPAEFRIRYAGPEKTFLTIPFIDLVENRVPPSVLEHAVVLVGVTANDLHDIVNTPFGPMPGVEAHANAVETILDGVFLKPLSPVAAVPLMLLVDLFGLLCIARIRRLPLLLLSLVLPFIALNLFVLALFSLNRIVPVLYLDLSFLGICGIGIAYQYASESREKRFIRKTFQYYLMPEVVQELIEHPEKLALGGERKEMTILFSDIRDFTAISEQLSPTDLTRLMNEYLTAMTDVIMEHGGLVDKYIGDAVMAFWGAPLENPAQAENACRAAVRMTERLAECNVSWKRDGMPELAMRIGVATGSVVVGNMGSLKRFNYTVMGDEVNFASRLESLNKAYGTECLVSESTRNAITARDLRFRELDIVCVKGKQEPRTIYELVTRVPDAVQNRVFERFSAGRQAYAKGDWALATERFTEALSLREDGPSRAFLRRAREYMDAPPERWDGVYAFQDK